MKIILTGAQGTGKTTVLNKFAENHPDLKVITEVVRNLSKEGININEQGNYEGQKLIFDTYKKLLTENDNYISDRGLTDVVAYTKYLMENTNDQNEAKALSSLYCEQMKDLIDFYKEYGLDSITMYFPIEFDLVDDGVRSMDECFRAKIDVNILEMLSNLQDYVGVNNLNGGTATGTVENRLDLMEDYIKAF